MSDDIFKERLKQAARGHAERVAANGRAGEARGEAQTRFLLDFHDKSSNVLGPLLTEAANDLYSSGKVMAGPMSSPDKDSITLLVTWGTKRAKLIFLVDPLLMRIRLRESSVDTADPDLSERAADIATLTLGDLERATLWPYIAEFVERHLR